MIVFYLLKLFILIGDVLTNMFGSVTVLPFGLDSILVTAVSYFHGAMETLPYLQVVWTVFLYVLGFEFIMLLLKLFLGHRLPANHSN